MNIYTGYYARTNEYKKHGLAPISISWKVPDKWLSDENKWYKSLAPKYDIWREYNTIHNEEIYVSRFTNEVLSKLEPSKVLSDLKVLSGDKDPILICYEKPECFCHRHIVGVWLYESLGIPVNEYYVSTKFEF